ncbi:hypothetical protein AB0A77_06845 [Streptomyces varsoviensis]
MARACTAHRHVQFVQADLTALGWSARIRAVASTYVGVAEPPAPGG